MRSIVRTGSKAVVVAAHYHPQRQIGKHKLPFFTIFLCPFLLPPLLVFFLSASTLTLVDVGVAAGVASGVGVGEGLRCKANSSPLSSKFALTQSVDHRICFHFPPSLYIVNARTSVQLRLGMARTCVLLRWRAGFWRGWLSNLAARRSVARRLI
jgi:hypothetical protein